MQSSQKIVITNGRMRESSVKTVKQNVDGF